MHRLLIHSFERLNRATCLRRDEADKMTLIRRSMKKPVLSTSCRTGFLAALETEN